MLRRHDPTYYLATRRLPARIQPATYALYGYVRAADQLVDGPRRPATPAERRAALDAWEEQLQAPRHPVALALTDAAGRHGLPLDELSTYMRSMRVDCEPPIRIDTYEQLVTYMDGSAGTVGRIMAALLGVPPDHHADLGRLGVAFQLANFIRDVREDRRLDRIYLPAEDREAFGVSDADLTGSSPRLRALLCHESERARALFAAAAPAIAAAPASVRPGVRLAVGLYRRMLDSPRPTGVRVWHLPGAALEAIR
jgi:phytoene synthase